MPPPHSFSQLNGALCTIQKTPSPICLNFLIWELNRTKGRFFTLFYLRGLTLYGKLRAKLGFPNNIRLQIYYFMLPHFSCIEKDDMKLLQIFTFSFPSLEGVAVFCLHTVMFLHAKLCMSMQFTAYKVNTQNHPFVAFFKILMYYKLYKYIH